MISQILDYAPLVAAIVGAIAAAVSWGKLNEDDRRWAIFGILALLMAWAFMNSMEKVAQAWKSPQYSHGWLIPVFAGILLYIRRREFLKDVPLWQQGLGVGIVLVSMLVRIYATHHTIMSLDRMMLIPCLLGLMVILGGLQALKWSAGPLCFLIFMYPLPRSIEQALLYPMQGFATRISHFALQTLGVECFTQGNRIMLDGMDMGVVDACSGLRMMTIFGALATAIAMISTNRPIWERAVILLSAVPIALAVNSIRITLTGVAYSVTGNEGDMVGIINTVAHDFAGWIMMPMALGLLYLEYQILARIVIEEAPEELSPLGLGTKRKD